MALQERNPIMVLVLSLCTLGIYGLIWYINTANDLREAGADIPSTILIIIPIANIFWLWKFCEGVEQVTGGQSGIMLFLLNFIGLGMVFAQMDINKKVAG